MNSRGGGASVSLESGYKEALKNAPDKLENIISYMGSEKIMLCTCSDIYEELKETWGYSGRVTVKQERGIQYENGERGACFMCVICNKEVYVYQIKHPSRSCKVKGEK